MEIVYNFKASTESWPAVVSCNARMRSFVLRHVVPSPAHPAHDQIFPLQVRAVISDFAVIISIIIMVLFDYFVGVNTPKLQIPHTFQPTAHNKRGWIIPPLGKNPWWIILAASIPALLATILVFMDQQITALIVNRREHKLKVCIDNNDNDNDNDNDSI